MATYTTVSAIRTALETTLAALAPAGDSFGQTVYEKASERKTWDEMPDSDRDRRFSIGEIPPGRAPNIGGHTSDIIETTLAIVVGHTKLGASDRHKSLGRRDRDLEQIARHLENAANYPTGVCVIEYQDVSVEENDKHWWSTLTFGLQYDGAV